MDTGVIGFGAKGKNHFGVYSEFKRVDSLGIYYTGLTNSVIPIKNSFSQIIAVPKTILY